MPCRNCCLSVSLCIRPISSHVCVLSMYSLVDMWAYIGY